MKKKMEIDGNKNLALMPLLPILCVCENHESFIANCNLLVNFTIISLF